MAVHCTSRAGDLKGQNVAVIGAGPIGNLVAQLCRARGASVLLADISDYRLEIARQCNLPNVCNVRQENAGPGVGPRVWRQRL